MTDSTSDAPSPIAPAHGSRRLDDHPLLGPLPPVEAVAFTLDGRTLTGRAGEPALAALLAAGVRVCRMMPQSGGARGGYCLVGRCADCVMQVDGEPNVRTCVAPLRAGMRVETQYGLGRWDVETAAPATSERRGRGMSDVQVAVVGGGPAGLSAAIAAARAGARTVLLDEHTEVGGQLGYRMALFPLGVGPRRVGVRPWVMRSDLIKQARQAGVDLRAGALAWGLFEDNVLAVVEPAASASYRLRAERIIVATGSTDLPFPFAGGTLPGVFSARALQILLHVHRVLPGRRVVVLGGGPEAEDVANDVRAAGGQVVATVAPTDPNEIAADGSAGVAAVVLGGRRLAVDVVAIAVGRQPDPQLALMAECAAGYSAALGGFVPVRDDRLVTTWPEILVAGDAAGLCDIPTALAEGTLAGVSAAVGLGLLTDQAVAEARTMLDRTAPDRLAAALAVKPTYVQN